MTEYADSEERSAMSELITFGKLDVIMAAVVFLQSLLIAWFLFLLIEGFESMAVFRFLLGVAIVFALMVPAFILLDGFQNLSITDSFIIPSALYAFMFMLFNSLIEGTLLFLDPFMILQALGGGIGFGLVGLGAYHLQRDLPRSFTSVTCGITLIFLSTPVILGGFLYIFTGDLSTLPAIIR